ncbi:MAG: hypothetical protein ACLFTR_02165 [Candidatus Woesearchaeota archaeon]
MKRMRRMFKRSEASQMFQMLTTLIVIGMIMILGFQLISNLFSTSEQIDYINFRRTIVNEIDAVASDYNARQRIEVSVPKGTDALCFIDMDHEGDLEEYPLVNSYWQDDEYRTQDDGLAKNAFLIGGDFFISFYVKNLEIDTTERYVCIEARRNNIELWVEGQGRKVTVEAVND